MRKIISVFLSGLGIMVSAQIGINTQTPEAELDVVSTESGVLLPRVEQARIRTLANPPKGLILFNTDENCLMINLAESTATDSDWQCLQTETAKIEN